MPVNQGEFDFSGKVVMVTGAGRGLGRALALAFARRGARVAANDLTPVNLDTTLARIAAAGGVARACVTDVTQPIPVHSMVEDIVKDWGRLDVLVNNAAVAPQTSLASIDSWAWQRTFDVNLGGPLWLMQAVARPMQAQGGGVILNLAARPTWLQTRCQRAGYRASQMALLELTRAAAHELADDHIAVLALCMGALVLDDPAGLGSDPADEPKTWAEGLGGSPCRMSPVVARALWLCSPAASHLTGQILDVAEELAEWQARRETSSPTTS